MACLLPHRAVTPSLQRAVMSASIGRLRCPCTPACHHLQTRAITAKRRPDHPMYRATTLNRWSNHEQWARYFSSIPQRNGDEPDVNHNDIDDDLPPINQTEQTIDHLTQLKEERRKLHSEKYRMALEKRESIRRKLLSEEWMRIFATSEELFRATLRELKVDKEECSDNNERAGGEKDSARSEYRSFYLDSLSSFGMALSEKDDDMTISAAASQALEKLGESDFADLSFSKKYRAMEAGLKRREELIAELPSVNESYSRALKDLDDEEKALSNMGAKLEVTDVDTKSSTVKDETTLTSSKNDFGDLEHIEEELTSSLLELLEGKDAKKKVKKQMNRVSNARGLAKSLSKRLEWIKTAIDGVELPLSQEEYRNATMLLMTISSDVVPDLAKFITSRHSDFEKYRVLEQHTDLTKPQEWYPRARLDKRKIIFHAGPTNSGKTYNALLRLKQAQKGMYLAPLRLLAAECYENLNSDGIYTSLVTGQEHRDVPFSTHRASTVELADLDEDYDVVVIDEIQMLCDSFRGFAWTRALMGVRCKEIHVCGGLEAQDIVEKIAKMCGDEFEMKTYDRFGELRVQDKSLATTSSTQGSYAKVEPGDCVVCFSRPDIFAVKKEIEKLTPYKCCVIYGTLPPAIRAEQARQFNDPNSGYEILIASDAIGMGLNLSIKRVIFNSMFKNNGEQIVRIDHSLVKQIAGRAGRRNSPYPHGEVTTRDPLDMNYLRKCMSTDIAPIQKAGLMPTASHIAMFDDLLNEYSTLQSKSSLHETLRKFNEMAAVKGDFFLCRKQGLDTVSRWLKDIDMSTAEKFTLCMSPVKDSCERSKGVLLRYVEKYSTGKVPGVHRSMSPREPTSFMKLAELCSIYHELDLFIWLQNKLPSNAVEAARANAMKEETIEKINLGLAHADKLRLDRYDYVSKDKNLRSIWTRNMRESKDGQFNSNAILN